MKWAFLAVLMLLSLRSPSVFAQDSWLAVYGDEARSSMSVDVAAPYMQFKTYVWAYPGPDGIICVDFRMDTPSWVFNTGTDFSSDVIVGIVQDMPYDEDGARICLSSCGDEPTWLCSVDHLPAIAGTPGEIRIVPRPSIGRVQGATCIEGNPLEEIEVFCMFGINYEPGCWFSLEDSTWGAIKALCCD